MMLTVDPLTASYADGVGSRAEQAVAQAGAGNLEGVHRHAALRDLEQYFIFTLLQEMRKSIPKDGLFGYGFANEIQDEMLDESLSNQVAASGQFGIAKMIDEQLRISEMQQQLRAQLDARSQPVQKAEGGQGVG